MLAWRHGTATVPGSVHNPGSENSLSDFGIWSRRSKRNLSKGAKSLQSTASDLKSKEVYELTAQHAWKGLPFDELMRVLSDYWRDFRFYDRLEKELGISECDSICDVGCGVVSVLNVFRADNPTIELCGLDPLVDEYAKLYPLDPTIKWQRAYLEAIELNRQFQLVCCTNALDHVEDLDRAMACLRTLVAPGGSLLLTVDVFASEMARNEGHPYSFTRDSFSRLLRRFGFDVQWQALCRAKLGMMKYADLRISKKLSRAAVMRRACAREIPRSFVKQLIHRGSLGELVLIAKRIESVSASA